MWRRLLLVAAVAAAATQGAAAAAEEKAHMEEYHGRAERLDISVPSPMSSNASSAVEVTNATIYIPLPDWLREPLWPSWLATTVGVVSFLLLAGLLACCCVGGCGAFLKKPEVLTAAPKVLCECSGSEKPTKDRLQLEVLLGLEMQYLFLGLGCLYGLATGAHQLPSILLLLAVPWVLRNLCLNICWRYGGQSYTSIEEKGCCDGLLEHAKTIVPILLGKLENLDSASDGLAVASAYFLTEEAQRRFALSFASNAGLIGWVCEHLGLGTLMFIALLYGTLIQGLLALSAAPGREESVLLLADLVGFAKVAEVSGSDSATADIRGASNNLFMVTVARVCSESMLQALLQTSMVMAQGQSLIQQPVLALSIFLSCTTLAGKAAGLLANLGPACRLYNGGQLDVGALVFKLVVNLFAALAVLAVLALILVKLYASQSCESRMWGLTTGCVDVA